MIEQKTVPAFQTRGLPSFPTKQIKKWWWAAAPHWGLTADIVLCLWYESCQSGFSHVWKQQECVCLIDLQMSWGRRSSLWAPFSSKTYETWCVFQPAAAASRTAYLKDGETDGQSDGPTERGTVTFSKRQGVSRNGIFNIFTHPHHLTPLSPNPYPCCHNTKTHTHTHNCLSWQDRFKCHTPLTHNTTLTEIILPCQDQRPHIVHHPLLWFITHTHAHTLKAVISECCEM